MSWTKRFSQNVLLRHLDLVLALVAGGLFLGAVLPSERPLEDPTRLLLGAVALSVALFLGVLVAGRWLQDRLRDDPYAQLIRSIDPTTANAQRPFTVTAVACVGAAIWSGFLLLTLEEFSRGVTVTLYAVEVALVTYVVLSALYAFLDLNRHQRRMQQVQAIKDAFDRDRRARGKEQGDSPPD